MKKYLVIVHTPRGTPADSSLHSYTVAVPPKAQWVTARSAEAAADFASVPPGGKAEVCAEEHVEVFTRADKAPLVSRLKVEHAAS